MSILVKLSVLFLVFSATVLKAQDSVRIAVDLTNIVDDRARVSVYLPNIDAKQAEYIMPAVIPGSYHRKDFGRFIQQPIAVYTNGKKKRIKSSGNVFYIKKPAQVEYITYWVDDTWDAPNDNFVFQPGGTNIQAKRNFVINHQGFYGYFEGYKQLPYSISYTIPNNHYPFTALKIQFTTGKATVSASDYVRLVDNPILICEPDTISFQSGNMHIHIGIFSENKIVKSELVKEAVEPLAKALTAFFAIAPVSDYYFMMYFPAHSRTGVARYGGFGALEHSYCSFYFVPEIPDRKQLIGLLQSIAGHEFLHILTPLNIHSEEIEFFDFRNPKMSQHLWLYEGVTEYFSNIISMQYHLIDEQELIIEITDKVKNAADYPLVSFTEMSKNILKEPYQSMYSNVYQKGALLAFFLDLELLEKSKGAFGLRELMLSLASKYGPNRPFKDDELIPEIVKLSYPEIKDFFSNYISGSTPLPYAYYFDKIGWQYFENTEVDIRSFGKLYFFADRSKNRIEVLNTDSLKNQFGLSTHDIILSVNDETVSPANYDPMLALEYPENDSKVTVQFLHGNDTITRSAQPKTQSEFKKFYIKKSSVLNENQVELRKHLFKL